MILKVSVSLCFQLLMKSKVLSMSCRSWNCPLLTLRALSSTPLHAFCITYSFESSKGLILPGRVCAVILPDMPFPCPLVHYKTEFVCPVVCESLLWCFPSFSYEPGVSSSHFSCHCFVSFVLTPFWGLKCRCASRLSLLAGTDPRHTRLTLRN